MKILKLLTFLLLGLAVCLAVWTEIQRGDPTVGVGVQQPVERPPAPSPTVAPTTHRNAAPDKTEWPACKTPLTVTVGTVDPQFGLSAAQFKTAILSAVDEWHAATGLTWFQISETDGIAVNLLYDGRQEELRKLEDRVAKLNLERASLNREQAINAIELSRLASNSRIVTAERNDRLRKALETQSELKRRETVLTTAIGELVKEAEHSEPYQAGQFVKAPGLAAIDIFAFSTPDDLHGHLLHELGHALGLGHLPQEDAVLYPLRMGKYGNFHLTAADVEAALSLCPKRS